MDREIQTFSGQRHGHGGVRKGIYTLKQNEETTGCIYFAHPELSLKVVGHIKRTQHIYKPIVWGERES